MDAASVPLSADLNTDNLKTNNLKNADEPAGRPLGGLDGRLLRLAALAGRDCPDCGCPVVLDGLGLTCADTLSLGAKCFRTWHDPETAEAADRPPSPNRL